MEIAKSTKSITGTLPIRGRLKTIVESQRSETPWKRFEINNQLNTRQFKQRPITIYHCLESAQYVLTPTVKRLTLVLPTKIRIET